MLFVLSPSISERIILLGILSMLKTGKKPNSKLKYFESAYQTLSNVNIEKYYFGNPKKIRDNYIEVKNIADWILTKIIELSDFNNEKNIS